MTQADYARHRGCTRQNICNLVRDGRLALTADGLIDVLAADAALPDLPQTDGGQPDTEDFGQPSTALSKAQLRKTEAEAALSEIKLAERAGKLIEAEGVAREVVNQFAALRDRLTVMPVRIAGQIVQLKTEREVSVLLAAAIEDELGAFADELRKAFAFAGPTDEVSEPPGERHPDGGDGDSAGADSSAAPESE